MNEAITELSGEDLDASELSSLMTDSDPESVKSLKQTTDKNGRNFSVKNLFKSKTSKESVDMRELMS